MPFPTQQRRCAFSPLNCLLDTLSLKSSTAAPPLCADTRRIQSLWQQVTTEVSKSDSDEDKPLKLSARKRKRSVPSDVESDLRQKLRDMYEKRSGVPVIAFLEIKKAVADRFPDFWKHALGSVENASLERALGNETKNSSCPVIDYIFKRAFRDEFSLQVEKGGQWKKHGAPSQYDAQGKQVGGNAVFNLKPK